MASTAERALMVRHREIADEVRALGDGTRPPYATASAFRFVYDRSAHRDLADVSAVAQELGVLLRAVWEQPVRLPQGVRSSGGVSAPTQLAVADHEQRHEVVLSAPASAAATEKAELGCRALERGWYEEAAELFSESAELVPTDAFAWYGAGMAASRFDRSLAAEWLNRASRYLVADDPGGAAYVAIVAAALHEEDGDLRSARRLLSSRLDELPGPCPMLSLHLARLGSGRADHVAAAVAIDPMLEADVVALGLAGDGAAVEVRSERTSQELGRLAYVAAELRRVGGDDVRLVDNAELPQSADLPLLGLELQLWRRIRMCEREVERARFAVEEREAARRAKERQLAEANERAASDLQHRVAVPFFALCVAIAVAIGVVAAAGRIAAPAAGVLSWMVTTITWATIFGLVGLTLWRLWVVLWPRRRFLDARAAKVAIPNIEWEAANLRNEELEAQQRFDRARQAAELRIRRVVDSRQGLVPHRPTFIGRSEG